VLGDEFDTGLLLEPHVLICVVLWCIWHEKVIHLFLHLLGWQRVKSLEEGVRIHNAVYTGRRILLRELAALRFLKVIRLVRRMGRGARCQVLGGP